MQVFDQKYWDETPDAMRLYNPDYLFTGKTIARVIPHKTFVKVVREDMTGSMGTKIVLGLNECPYVPYADLIRSTDVAQNGFYFSDKDNLWDDLYDYTGHVCTLRIPDDALVSLWLRIRPGGGITSGATNKIIVDEIVPLKTYLLEMQNKPS